MKRFFIPTTLSSLLILAAMPALAQTDMYLENPGFTGTAQFGYTGNIGNNFQLVAADVPAGDTVNVTALGFYAGISGSGQWSTAGTVLQSHTLSLWGPKTSSGGSFSGLSLDSVTLNAGATVDANGFAWVTLSTPTALVPGDYYLLMASVTSGSAGTSDPYLNPYDSSSPQNAAITPDASGVITGTPFYVSEGAYNTTGGYAYTWSTYLGPNLQYVMVPEPSILALLVSSMAMTLALVSRRRASK